MYKPITIKFVIKKLKQLVKNIFINNKFSLKKFEQKKVENFLKKIKIIDSGHK